MVTYVLYLPKGYNELRQIVQIKTKCFCFAVGVSQEIGKNCKFFICLLYFAGA